MIDLDASLYVEYDDLTKEPVALIETAIDVGQEYKSATVTKRLAERASLPAFTLLYMLGSEKNPADCGFMDITAFRVKILNWPYPVVTGKEPKAGWVEKTPIEWCEFLLWLRIRHAMTLEDKK